MFSFLDILRNKAEADVDINAMMLCHTDDQGLRAWLCCICDYSNPRKEVTYKHCDAKHYNYKYSCEFCWKIVNTQHALSQHISAHHK